MVASHVAPTGDLAHNPGMCLEWEGIEPVTLWFTAHTQSTELHQPGLLLCFESRLEGWCENEEGSLTIFAEMPGFYIRNSLWSVYKD